MDPTPQRLQTALGLYSNDLCGLVLLSDNHLGSYSGVTKGAFRTQLIKLTFAFFFYISFSNVVSIATTSLKQLYIPELCSICQLTTEFHFSSMDEQLEKIREDVKDAVAWRQAHYREGSDPHVSSDRK